jgi:phytoene desaturase
MNKTAIVVGSGVGGLASAARLAAKGLNVTVYEASTTYGGKLGLTGNKHYRFDLGPSLFTLPQLVTNTIEDCGKNPIDYFDYSKRAIACQYFWDDGTALTAWGNAVKFADEVEGKLGVKASLVLDYLKMSKHIYETTQPVFLEKSLHKLNSYLNKETLSAISQMHKLHLTGTLHDLNQKKLEHPKLVQLFDRFATYNGSSPYLTPGVMSSIPHLEHNVGTFYPKGGMRQIVTALYNLALDLGVDFKFSSPVERIVIEQKRAVGVEQAGNFYPADIVISNMDVVPTYRKLLKDVRAPEKVLSQERSSSALIFYWGIKKQFKELDLHNIFFSNNYKAEFQAIFKDKTTYIDPTVYVNISSKAEAGDAPKNGENWFVMVNVPGNTGQDWDTLIPEVRQSVISKLSQNLKENIEDLIEFEDILEPRTIEANTGSYQGSLYGASSNNTMAAFLRHPNFSKRLANLYFCGGSVHPGGGIPLCLLSAKITASLIKSS